MKEWYSHESFEQLRMQMAMKQAGPNATPDIVALHMVS